jgi:uncharacterized protein (DUF2237 family)
MIRDIEQGEGNKAPRNDHWCLCAGRWLEAYEAGKAPRVNLEATNEAALAIVPIEALQEHAI